MAGSTKTATADEVIEEFFNSISNEVSAHYVNPGFGFTLEKVVLRNSWGEEVNEFRPGDDLVVEVSYHAQKRIPRPILSVNVVGTNGTCFTSNMLLDGNRPEFLEGTGQIKCTFKSIPLLPQSYTVKLALKAENITDVIIAYREVALFNVGDLADYGYRGEFIAWASRSTPVVVPYEWCLPDGTTTTVALIRQDSSRIRRHPSLRCLRRWQCTKRNDEGIKPRLQREQFFGELGHDG